MSQADRIFGADASARLARSGRVRRPSRQLALVRIESVAGAVVTQKRLPNGRSCSTVAVVDENPRNTCTSAISHAEVVSWLAVIHDKRED